MINSTKEWNWIYESPDGGATVTRRPFMSQDNSEKIVIKENGKELKKEDQYKFYSWLR